LNAPGAFGYPFATWGARIRFEPVDQFYVMAGVYDGDPAVKDPTSHGVDFSPKGPPFVIGEFGFRPNYDKDGMGLPTNLKFGAGGLAATAVAGNYGLYALGDPPSEMSRKRLPVEREGGSERLGAALARGEELAGV